MHLSHERPEPCPYCGRVMDHSGTRYYITMENNTERTEICPVCYVRIEQSRLEKGERDADTKNLF